MTLTLIALTVGMTATTTALTSDDSENSTVQVQVASLTAIDVTPSLLDYNSINPGERDEVDDAEGFTGVEVENIGSVNITQVWANATVPQDRPFGSGFATEYDAGNFIQINATGEGQAGVVGPDDYYSFVNRREYNESNDLNYIFTPPSPEEWRYGRFRAGDQEFFWAVNTSISGSGCDADADSDDFRVGTAAHNETKTGSNDFTDGSGEYYSRALTDVPGLESSERLATDVWLNVPGQSNRTYDVVVNCGSQTYTTRTRYNVQMDGATDLALDGATARHLVNATAGGAGELQPGDHFSIDMAVSVPLGVANGDVSDGLFRILVNAQ